MTRVVVITGPTAGGKSALALALAQHLDAVIVNADSMQVYRELHILTARPSRDDEAAAEHRLYGHVPAAEPYSAGRFATEAKAELDRARTQGRPAIVVGGTGLYLETLLIGLSPIPPIPDDIRMAVRAEAAAAPPGDLHRRLFLIDPMMAERLSPSDIQRITRALEVHAATGRSLAEWQRAAGTPVVPIGDTVRVALVPPRAEIDRRIETRARQMLDAGALDDVRALAMLGLSPQLPAMRALGVSPLLAHLEGEIDRDEALGRLILDTRQYVKRQLTWLARTRFPFDVRAEAVTDAVVSEIVTRADFG